jgi:VCBS repeat-containing protein
MKRRLHRPERLESRNLLAAAVINEILFDRLFGDVDTDQYVELRGEPNSVLEDGTYLVVVESEKLPGNAEGKIHGIFDLSGQVFGSNGFLVLLQQDSPFTPDPAATTLQSTLPAFGGLPGGIYTDSHATSDHIDSIVASNTFFLIQTDVPPQLGDDIDADSDGLIDPEGIITNWNVLDSISAMWSLRDGHGYGDIVFADSNDVLYPEITVAEGTPLIRLDGFGYVGRIGNSTASTAEDWVAGVVKDLEEDQYFVRLAGDVHGRPAPIVFHGRELDHVGSENFAAGARLHLFEDSDGNGLFDAGESPISNALLLADSNGNGIRDLQETIIEPNNFPEDLELNNLTHGVSLSTAGDENIILGFTVEARQMSSAPVGEYVFTHYKIPFHNSTRRLRMDFYRPAQVVALDFIGNSNSSPTYGRLEAFDAEGNSIQMIRTAPLGAGVRQRLSITLPDDRIAYAVAYSDENYLNSSPFGRLDRLSFKIPEAASVTNQQGMATLNYLAPGSYTVVSDPESTGSYIFGSPQFVVTGVENFDYSIAATVNQPPVIDTAILSVDEGSVGGTVVGTITATDHPAQSIRFSIVDGDDKFTIDPISGIVRVRAGAVLDFETQSQQSIRVRATDNAPVPLSSELDFVVEIGDRNEPPSIANFEFEVDENSDLGTIIGVVSATDPDAGDAGVVNYRIVGANPSQAFSVNATTGALTVNSLSFFNFEVRTQAQVTVEAYDSGIPSLTDTAVVTVRLRDVNEPPVILTQQITIGELAPAGTVAGTLQVQDPEVSQFHTFAWADGFESDVFEIDGNSGQISLRAGVQLSFADQSEYPLEVTATDSGFPPMTTSKVITVRVIDENNPPAIQDLELQVDENAAVGTVIGTATVVDPDVGQSHVFAIVGGSGRNLFTIDSDNGELSVAPGAEIDFETQTEVEIIIQAWDSGFPTATSERTFVVSINDVNEPPAVIGQNTFAVAEDSPGGTEIGQIAFADPDANDVVSIAIVDGQAELFEIDPDTGVLTLRQLATLDFETEPQYQFTVEVSDGVNPAVQAQVTVTIEDRNDAPIVVGEIQPQQVLAGYGLNYQIPDNLIVDVDAGQTLTWSLEGEAGSVPAWIEFDPATGLLTGLPWNDQQGTSSLRLVATDNGEPAMSASIPLTIQVAFNSAIWQNVNDPLDVDGNRDVRSIDALVIINYLNRSSLINIPSDVTFRPAFLDVNGNNRVEPIDALRVINFLNRGSGSGEGEFFAASAALAFDRFDPMGIDLQAEKRRRIAIDNALLELFPA